MENMINDIVSVFSLDFMLPAFIGGILVSLCAALLGVTLVLKRCSMIGDGLSHVGFGALAIAAVMGIAPLKLAIPVVIIGAVVLLRMTENSRIKGDSAIALLSTSALAIGIFVSSKAKMTNDVSSYMFGSILAMSKSDATVVAVLSIVVVLLYIIFYRKIFAVTFDDSFATSNGIKVSFYSMMIAVLTALTVVFGMLMMGALLISSLIVFPSLTAMRVCKSYKGVIVCAAGVSIFSFVMGIMLAIVCDTSPGASVVIVNLVVFAIFYVIGKFKSRG